MDMERSQGDTKGIVSVCPSACCLLYVERPHPSLPLINMVKLPRPCSQALQISTTDIFRGCRGKYLGYKECVGRSCGAAALQIYHKACKNSRTSLHNGSSNDNNNHNNLSDRSNQGVRGRDPSLGIRPKVFIWGCFCFRLLLLLVAGSLYTYT